MNIFASAWVSIAAAIKRVVCLGRCEDAKKAPDRNKQLAEHLLSQYRDEFIFATAPSGGETPVENTKMLVERIDGLFKRCDEIADKDDDDNNLHRWEWAYEIERLLVYIKPSTKLAIDVERRVEDAKRAGLPSADKYRAQLDALNTRLNNARAALTAVTVQAAAKPGDAALTAAKTQAEGQWKDEEARADRERRAILSAALDDIQWQSQKTVLVRKATWDSASNLLCFGIATMFVVTLPFLCFVFERWTGLEWFSNLLENFPNYGLYTAMSFGLLGAYFSRLTSLSFTGNLTLEDAENRYSYSSLMIRGGVGMCGALLFYFLMRAGVLGNIAPKFEELSFTRESTITVLIPYGIDVLIPSIDWAKLVLWSFLAGFSEKLVSDSLTKVEASVSGKKS